MDTLPMDKKNAISDMGFRDLMQLSCKELRYELIMWIVANYDIGYHLLCMETKVDVPVTPKDVREVLGILDNGVDILIYNRQAHPTAHTTLKYWKLICVIYRWRRIHEILPHFRLCHYPCPQLKTIRYA